MSKIKNYLRQSLGLCLGIIIFITLLIVGIYILSYVIIAAAVVMIVGFIIAKTRHLFSTNKPPSVFTEDGKKHRIINQDPEKN